MRLRPWLLGSALSLSIAAPSAAITIPLTAKLEAGQAVPPTDSLGFGAGTLVYDTVSRILTWAVVVTDVLFHSPELGAAIHGPASPGATGPSLVPLGIGSLKLGSVDLDDLCADPLACEADLLDSLWYVNVTSEDHASGEVRGQIVPLLALELDEPSAWMLLAAGLVGLVLVPNLPRPGHGPRV
jgi:hypothetical protein